MSADTIEAPACVGDTALGRRAAGGWWWTVVVDTAGPYPMAIGGQARTALGAYLAARRALRTGGPRWMHDVGPVTVTDS